VTEVVVRLILEVGKWASNVSLLVKGHDLWRSELVDTGHTVVISELWNRGCRLTIMNNSFHLIQVINVMVVNLYLSDSSKELRVASQSLNFYLFVLIRSFHRLQCKEDLSQNLLNHSTFAIHLQVLTVFDRITLFFDFCYYYMHLTE
jgi:hypothetical protein